MSYTIMNLRNPFLIAITGLLLLASCKEDNPGVIFDKPTVSFTDTTYIASTPETPQPKRALLEDFTGVQCSNCPKGHRAIETMQASNPDRIVALSIHGKQIAFFTDPYPGYEDFRVPYTDQIYPIILGAPSPAGLPFGAVDRILRSTTVGNWASLANTRIAGNTPVNLYIDKAYNDATRELSVKLKAVFTDTMGTRPFFSVGIAESGIVSLQKDEDYPGKLDSNYVHNHVLRYMPAFKEQLLPPDSIVPLPEKNRVIEKTFTTTLNQKWNAEKCSIVFYVHRDVEVIHVVEVKVK